MRNQKPTSFKITLLALLVIGSMQLTTQKQLTQTEYDQLAAMADAPAWTLNGRSFLCKVQKVYDGDSYKCIIKYAEEFWKFDFRANGLDTPEVASGVVRDFGKEVRDILQGIILNKIIKVQALEADKYGRILGDFYFVQADGTETNLNAFLIDHGMAKAYDGGTKVEFAQADYNYFINNYRNSVWPTAVNYPNF